MSTDRMKINYDENKSLGGGWGIIYELSSFSLTSRRGDNRYIENISSVTENFLCECNNNIPG